MYKIRKADRQDSGKIFDLICALAEYEKMADLVTGDAVMLERMLFDMGVGRCLVAEEDGKTVGFALWFYNLSTFKCKPGIYLEDLFVLPEYRGRGIGKALLQSLGKIAIEENIGRIEWSCLDWNTPSLEFYRRMGAKPQNEWVHLRVDEADFETFSE
jgi:GNAT superfamily N-acetyltransferase